MQLSLLGFTEKNGLVYCNDPDSPQNEAERLYISDAKKLNAQAVLFRRYFREQDDSKPYYSEPAVCIFKEEDISFNSDSHISLHAALWSSGKNEIYIIYGQSKIDIINARKPAPIKYTKSDKEVTLESLILASGSIEELDKERFSALQFASGTFWEQPKLESHLDQKDSPHIHLLDYLMQVRKKFISDTSLNLNPSTVDKLLVVSILVKFLEEIKDPGDDLHTLREIYKENNVSSLIAAVRSGCLLKIFDALSDEFNGRIFDKFTQAEKHSIQDSNLDLLAQFLEAKIDLNTNQLFFWEQYSFEYLPAEVISSIYENFIQAEARRKRGEKEKGVVYTPIHLVNFLIDDVMPLDKAEEYFGDEKFKVLDPACGSGVFLVAAYKRLLQWWALNNSNNGEIKYPNSKIAQRILENNIYGVDVKETATLVSVFSLTTALLDRLSPKEIWRNLELRDLNEKNITQNSFFPWAAKKVSSNLSFDLVIGNPPFNTETSKTKKDVLKDSTLDEIDFTNKNIPKNNLALHFFEGAMKLGEKVCMIIPSSILLYYNANTGQAYRESLFTNYNVTDIYDFTHLRRNLFHRSADTPVVALIAENHSSEKKPINHTVVKRLTNSEKKIRFEIDYYDRHSVPWSWAIDASKQFIWKVNLLGGGRLFNLIYRLSNMQTLGDFIDSKEKLNEERGFEGGSKEKIEDVDRIFSINCSGKVEVRRGISFKTGKLKDQFMYEPPFLLIDQVLGEDSLLVSYIKSSHVKTNKSRLYYNRDFVGISSTVKNSSILEDIYKFLLPKSESTFNCQLYLLGTSSSCLVTTETDINKSEILSLPFPENKDKLKLNKQEKILQKDVLKYYRNLGKSISRGSGAYPLHKKVNRKQLEAFGIILCESLNSIYAREYSSWQLGKIYQNSVCTVVQIGFGEDNKLKTKFSKSLDVDLIELLNNAQANRGAIYKRVIKLYQHINGFDSVFFIKPNSCRYWLGSIALRDADDIFSDLKQEGF